MAGQKKSFLIPARDLTPIEAKYVRDTLSETLVRLLQNDGKIINPDNAVVRDGLANADYAVGNATAQNWITPALVANTVATFINNPMTNNKYAGFYGVSTSSANPVISLLRFAIGATGGSTRGRFQLEMIYAELQPVGYFPDPVLYAPTETVFVEVTPYVANAAGERMVLKSLVAEPKGPFVS